MLQHEVSRRHRSSVYSRPEDVARADVPRRQRGPFHTSRAIVVTSAADDPRPNDRWVALEGDDPAHVAKLNETLEELARLGAPAVSRRPWVRPYDGTRRAEQAEQAPDVRAARRELALVETRHELGLASDEDLAAAVARLEELRADRVPAVQRLRLRAHVLREALTRARRARARTDREDADAALAAQVSSRVLPLVRQLIAEATALAPQIRGRHAWALGVVSPKALAAIERSLARFCASAPAAPAPPASPKRARRGVDA